MKYIRVLRYSSLSAMVLFFCIVHTYGQVSPIPIINATLTGSVIDGVSKGPLEGVTIQLDAVTHSVKTDRDGRFQFVTGQKLPFTLSISYIGYESKTVVVNTSPTIIELFPVSEDIDEDRKSTRLNSSH